MTSSLRSATAVSVVRFAPKRAAAPEPLRAAAAPRAWQPAPHAGPAEPFAQRGFPAGASPLAHKTRQMLGAVAADLDALDTGDDTGGSLRLRSLINSAAGLDPAERAEAVNRWVNGAVRYQRDAGDQWSSPLETLERGHGDCEDFAIAKYAVLRATGVPDADLRLVIGRDRALREDHMVLAVRHGGRWSMLDNRTNRIFEDREYPNFTPRFAIDGLGLKQLGSPPPEPFTLASRLRVVAP
jgi:predicted transglutaminase-like cysteine proteinase